MADEDGLMLQVIAAGSHGICAAELKHQMKKQGLGSHRIRTILAELRTKPNVRQSRERRANRGGWLQEQTVLRYTPSDR